MFESLIFVGVVLVTQFIKKYVYPKWGDTGVHVLIFTLSLIGLGVYEYAQYNPAFMDVLVWSLGYLAGAVALYEVILKKIGFKSSTTQLEDDQR